MKEGHMKPEYVIEYYENNDMVYAELFHAFELAAIRAMQEAKNTRQEVFLTRWTGESTTSERVRVLP